jgi:vitamin B12 transporter
MLLAVSLGLATMLVVSPAAGQWPGEVAGTVTDAVSGEPVPAAGVEVVEPGRRALTDGTGAFRVRGLEPGRVRVRVRRAGYAAREETVEVENGRVTRVSIALHPSAVALDAVRAQAAGDRLRDGTRLDRAEIERSGAATAAELLRGIPGVVVGGPPGGAQTASIRGSGTDAVLLLVDGVPANDPVTGEADLGAVPAHAIQSVTVLPGARAARYGPRASGGVIVIETRSPDRRRAASLRAGRLGERAADGEWGWAAGGAAWSVGGAARRVDGAFTHPRDENDPTPRTRENADVEEWSAFGAGAASVLGGDMRLRGGWERLDRGIPGFGYAPSVHARQTLERGRASLGWRRAGARTTASLSAAGVTQASHYRDPQPPFGEAYDSRTRVRSLHLRGEAERAGAGWLRAYGAGAEATVQRVDAGTLAETAPRTRMDGGAFAHASLGRTAGETDLELALEARADRDGVTHDVHLSHGVTLSATRGGVRAHLASRSSYSPPSLGDQFFREGVAVAPNPDLRAERVPAEWEAGAAWTGGPASLGATAFVGHVDGMIVWLPDFRNVWSPRNQDVRRVGGEAWAELRLPRDLHLTASYGLARVTYERADGADVQVVYRPRHLLNAAGRWTPGPWRLDVAARWTGARNPDPGTDNTLPGFWTLDAGVARTWRAGPVRLDTSLYVDRLRDERSALIAGYPEPGRRARLEVRVRRADLD